MDIREVMTPDPACCTPDSSLRDAAKLMRDCDCGEIPVVADKESRKPIGVITDRDIVIRSLGEGRDPQSLKVSDCMSSPAITVTPETSLVECCDLMEREQIRRVPVVDEGGRLCGIVALADIAQHAGRRSTAELVKEVSQPNGGRSS
jgi:CBS domain-containing protein